MLVWFDTLLQDVNIAFRLMRRTPLLTGVALLSTALSIGTTAVVFAAIKSVLLEPLPYARPNELVQLRTNSLADDRPGNTDWIFWRDIQEIVRRTRTLSSIGVYGNAVHDLGGGSSGPPEALYGLRVSANLFPTLGVSPLLGRSIRPGEDQPGRPSEMILSYGLWSRRFHKDRNIVGRSVQVDGHDCLVIGVMPPDFDFPLRRAATHTPQPYVDFWAPPPVEREDTEGALGAVARLRPGVSLAEAQQDLASISSALRREFPRTNRDRALHLSLLSDRTIRGARNALWFLMAAALMFLLIGCANVANLLLARGFLRQREIAIRVAIGAATHRIVRQLLTESCVLGLLGGLGGYLLTVAAWQILPALAPVTIPRLAAARADSAVLAFALGLALVNGLLFGIAPALRFAASTASLQLGDLPARGAASGKQDRIRTFLVIAEIAVTLVLVLIGSQLLGTFVALLRTDPGFQGSRILASVVLPSSKRYPTSGQRAIVYRKFLDSVRALAGVESAGTVDALPFSGENHGGFITAAVSESRKPDSPLIAEVDIVGGDYLQTLGVRLESGRWFRPEDMHESGDAAIVNDVAARQLWPHAGAIGQRLCVDCTPEHPGNWKRVIAVVSSIRHMTLQGPMQPNVYLAAGALENAAFLVVKTDRPTSEMEKAVRRAVAAVDPDQPVLLSASMQSLISDTISDRRFILCLLVFTGTLALLLSVAGIYGVSSYITSRRTREIGIRMALGATRGNVLALIFRQGFQNVVVGLIVGFAMTLALMQLLRGVIAGLDTARPADFLLAASVVTLTAALACWLPARRAARAEPLVALRHD